MARKKYDPKREKLEAELADLTERCHREYDRVRRTFHRLEKYYLAFRRKHKALGQYLDQQAGTQSNAKDD